MIVTSRSAVVVSISSLPLTPLLCSLYPTPHGCVVSVWGCARSNSCTVRCLSLKRVLSLSYNVLLLSYVDDVRRQQCEENSREDCEGNSFRSPTEGANSHTHRNLLFLLETTATITAGPAAAAIIVSSLPSPLTQIVIDCVIDARFQIILQFNVTEKRWFNTDVNCWEQWIIPLKLLPSPTTLEEPSTIVLPRRLFRAGMLARFVKLVLMRSRRAS